MSVESFKPDLANWIENERGLIAKCIVPGRNGPVSLLHSPASRLVVDGFPWFGCWPLVPFANRAFGGIVNTPDGPIHLPLNDAKNGAAIHGFSANALWQTVARSETEVTIEHHKDSGDDPYRYRARQIFALKGQSLEIGLSVRNEAERALPYGIGLHPWFPCDSDTTFQAMAGQAVRFGPGYRPTGSGFVDEGSDWRKARLLQGAERVANFLDWDGLATLHYPSRQHSIQIEASDTMRFALLWTPGDKDFVCFEPQSHVIAAPSDALAAGLSPMALLAKGETLSGWMRLSLIEH
jgi:aldose 1-epimerase